MDSLAHPEKLPRSFAIGPVSLWTPDKEILDEAAIVIEDGSIAFYGSFEEGKKQYTEIQWFEAPNYLVTPGFIDSHTHMALNFLKAIAHKNKEVIYDLFFPREKHLTPDLTEALAYSSLYASLRSGVTCINDHYYFAEAVAAAAETLGIKAFVGETAADVGGAFPGRKSWEKFTALIDNWPFSDRIKPVVAPHATDTTTPDFFKEQANFAKSNGLPIHFHLAQSKKEFDQAKKDHGKTPVRLAYEAGALFENSLAVHLIYLEKEDYQILKDSGATVVVCPSSQILFDRLAPIESFIEYELPIALGTDCASTNDQMDLLSELKIFHLFALNKDLSVTEKSCLEQIISVPRQSLQIPKIEAGSAADLNFFKKDLQVGYFSDLSCDLIYNLNQDKLQHVMINGQWVLKNQKLAKASEDDLMLKYEDARKKIEALA